jgi:hypothetical protein
MRRGRKIATPDPGVTDEATLAVEQARQELAAAVHTAAQAEQVSRWHMRIRERNRIGPAMALEYARTR